MSNLVRRHAKLTKLTTLPVRMLEHVHFEAALHLGRPGVERLQRGGEPFARPRRTDNRQVAAAPTELPIEDEERSPPK